ncbi:MAG: MATE family efflux transporter [Lachnospiraceae bacterium]|nr:MATE family efflux transporter [Lachnospiraceae bacterium]
MEIRLSEHFTYRKLLKFTLPSIIMMIFTSVYGVVDGLFVSNFVGKTAFTAVNFTMPILMILGTVGFMFGTGGSAIIAKTMGEGKPEEANRQFSLLVWACFLLGAVLAVLGILFLPQILTLMGAEGDMLKDCILYGRTALIALPAYNLQYAFQSFFITAEKPDLGLRVTIAAGVSNMVLDALLIGVCSFGIAGAALATGLSQCVGGLLPLLYFARSNPTPLRIRKPKIQGRILAAACVNGSSELLSNIAMSVVSMLYNVQLLKYAGEDGVAAYGVLMYVSMIFIAVSIGYSMGTAPVVSYHYGAENHSELQSLRKKSLILIGSSSLVMVLLAEVLARPIALIFSGYDADLLEMTVRAFFIFSFSFLFSGFSIWCSSFFTALNNGPVSAAISFLRTLVFQVAAVLLLPVWLGLDGIWLSIVVAEVMSFLIGASLLAALRRRYNY